MYLKPESYIDFENRASLVLYAPGNLTPAGFAEPPPVTLIWKHET